MPRRSASWIPPIHHHKPSNRGRVRLNGRDYYVGPWPAGEKNPPAQTLANYNALIKRWLAAGRQPLTVEKVDSTDPNDLSVADLILLYMPYAEAKYTDPRELQAVKASLRPVRELYGTTPAASFGPKALKAVRQAMIERGWCRTTVNKRVVRVRSFFRWAESEELVPASTYHALLTVQGLPLNAQGVKHRPPMKLPTEEQLLAVVPKCTKAVAVMIQLQFYAAMRSGEVRLMRTCDIDITNPACWVYRPSKHKNQWRGRDRTIALGPKCIELLRPWLMPDNPEAFIFSPQRAEAIRLAERRANRKTPLWPSHLRHQKQKRKKNRKRPLGSLYTSFSYPHALRKACKKAGVESFTPYSLRHAGKMRIERLAGSEAARAVLGHKSIEITTHYGSVDLAHAIETMSAHG